MRRQLAQVTARLKLRVSAEEGFGERPHLSQAHRARKRETGVAQRIAGSGFQEIAQRGDTVQMRSSSRLRRSASWQTRRDSARTHTPFSTGSETTLSLIPAPLGCRPALHAAGSAEKSSRIGSEVIEFVC